MIRQHSGTVDSQQSERVRWSRSSGSQSVQPSSRDQHGTLQIVDMWLLKLESTKIYTLNGKDELVTDRMANRWLSWHQMSLPTVSQLEKCQVAVQFLYQQYSANH